MLEYNKEMFLQTLSAAELSFIEMDEIKYDDTVLQAGGKYLLKFLEDPQPLQWAGNDADRYYYLIASHALYAGFDIAIWEMQGATLEGSLNTVMTIDSISTFRLICQSISKDSVDDYASDVFDLSVNDLVNEFGQKYIIDNKNQYILGLLLAFFVIGYNCRPSMFSW